MVVKFLFIFWTWKLLKTIRYLHLLIYLCLLIYWYNISLFFREESSLVPDMFVLEILVVYVECLALAHADDKSLGINSTTIRFYKHWTRLKVASMLMLLQFFLSKCCPLINHFSMEYCIWWRKSCCWANYSWVSDSCNGAKKFGDSDERETEREKQYNSFMKSAHI